MAYPVKPAAPRRSQPLAKSAVVGAVLLATLPVGCSVLGQGPTGRAQAATEATPRASAPQTSSTAGPGAAGGKPIQLAAHNEPEPPATDGHEDKGESPEPKTTITLPTAIEMCVTNNLRVQAQGERVRMAEADLTTSSLIPNPSLFADYQLIPLEHADVTNQLGPPQWDALVTFPIDWLLFGKRVAAMREARLGIDVSTADAADVLRTQLAQTVDAFYEVLEDDAYFKLSEKYLADLTALEKLTEDMAKDKKVGALEVDRIKLAVHEALLERHDRELAVEVAKARLRPFIGRTAADPDYDVEGALTVAAVVPPPTLEQAVALAEARRPDLLSGRTAIDQAKAAVDLERRRAKPQVSIQPGWTYQNQHYVDGFRNGSLFDIGVSTSLPLTDRNQGNIRKAEAQAQERLLTYQADRADVLADVETAVASYGDAVEHLTQFNTAETLKAADDLRKSMEAAYKAGDRKLIELLDAERAYRDRLGHVIEFESDYWRWLNRLNAAVGLNACDAGKGQAQPFGDGADGK